MDLFFNSFMVTNHCLGQDKMVCLIWISFICSLDPHTIEAEDNLAVKINHSQ